MIIIWFTKFARIQIQVPQYGSTFYNSYWAETWNTIMQRVCDFTCCFMFSSYYTSISAGRCIYLTDVTISKWCMHIYYWYLFIASDKRISFCIWLLFMHTVGDDIKSKTCSTANNTFSSTSILCWPLPHHSCAIYCVLVQNARFMLYDFAKNITAWDRNRYKFWQCRYFVCALLLSILQFVIICLFHSWGSFNGKTNNTLTFTIIVIS